MLFATDLTEVCVPDLNPEDRVLLFLSGSSAFTIDLWGNQSDPFLQATLFFASIGCVLCVQVSKQFLAERVNTETGVEIPMNFTAEYYARNSSAPAPSVLDNATETSNSFHSEVENVFYIIAAISCFGAAMQMTCWFHSGCSLSHLQNTRGEKQPTALQISHAQTMSRSYLLVASVLLCCVAFLGSSSEDNFSAFGITFTVNVLEWTKSDASNLITVFWLSTLMSRIVTIVFVKLVQVQVYNVMFASTLVGLGGTLLMTVALKVTTLSLWIGASLLGLGIGNMLANTLNAGKWLTSQTGVISSVIFASAYTGKIVAPLLIGYLLDHVDPMWFLYLGVVFSSGVLVLLVVFQGVQMYGGRKCEGARQECDVPLEKTQQTHEV